VVVRRLRIERDLLQAEDPAAGSEIFTIRGFIRQLRASTSAVIARVRKIQRRRVLVGATITAAALGGVLMMMPKTKEKPAMAAQAQVTRGKAYAAPVIEPSGARSQVEPMGDGRIKITLDLVEASPVNIAAIAGMRNVPPMWMARMRVEPIEGIALQVGMLAGDGIKSISIGEAHTLTQSNCSIGEVPLGLHFEGPPGHYVIYVEPTLTPAGC
jgi:hypothetical protein